MRNLSLNLRLSDRLLEHTSAVFVRTFNTLPKWGGAEQKLEPQKVRSMVDQVESTKSLCALTWVKETIENTYGGTEKKPRIDKLLFDLKVHLEKMKAMRLERARLSDLGYMRSADSQKELLGMAFTGFCGCFAAGVHPIFLVGVFFGVRISWQSRAAERKKLESIENLRQINKTLKFEEEKFFENISLLKAVL